MKGDGSGSISAAVTGTDYLGIDNGVRYDVTQSLTNTQQTRARENIGAAPDGYGLGQSSMEILDDCNNAVLSGWYCCDNTTLNVPAESGIGILCVSRCFSNRIYQEFHIANGNKLSLFSCSRVYYEDSSGNLQWGEWEYINPPLVVGVEYRTTERYLNKPVYVKVTDCGALPNATYKTVQTSFPNADAFISITGTAYQDANHIISLPCQSYGSDAFTYNNPVQIKVNNPNKIIIATNTDMSSFTKSSVCVKYTKSTD